MYQHENVDTVLARSKTVESCDAAAVEKLLSHDGMQVELPNLLKPQGGGRRLPDLLDGLTMACKILQSQHYDIINICVELDCVALEANGSVLWRYHWAAAAGRRHNLPFGIMTLCSGCI